MAAIKPYREDVENEEDPSGTSTVQVPEAGDQSRPAPELGAIIEQSTQRPQRQAELVRMWWIRQELMGALKQYRYHVIPKKDGRAAFQLLDANDRPVEIPADYIGWFSGPMDHGEYSFFTSNSKMDCPTWDLPAGAPGIGGTCPNAIACQSIVPESMREAAKRNMIPPPGSNSIKVDEDEAICSACYATGGNYPSPHVQAAEIVRYWWTFDSLKTAEGRAEWLDTMAEAVLAEGRKPTRHGIRPFRVHSSGDFFSPEYFELWVELARRIDKLDPSVRFWAPSRVWGQPRYNWALLAGSRNFIVRPSAYHVGDVAPESFIEGQGRGTTAIYHHDNAGMDRESEERAWAQQSPAARKALREHFEKIRAAKGGVDRRYDWLCQAYAVGFGKGDLAKSCTKATGPDGKVGCRACWMMRALRICYTVH